MSNNAYEQGCQACYDFTYYGKETPNPYPEGSDEYLMFEAGYGDEKCCKTVRLTVDT